MAKTNKIGDAIAATLASVTASTPEAVSGSERTIEVITSEILRLKAETGERLIAIGQRLIEAKGMLAHGEWLPWLEQNVEMSEKTAQDFMRIAREFSNPQALADLGKTKVLKLLLLPAAEREEFLAEHDVQGMSTRELDQAIRERDEARKAAEYSEQKLGELNRDFEASQTALLDEKALTKELRTQIKELESRPVDVAVREPTAEEVDARAREIAQVAISDVEHEAEERIKQLEEQLAAAKEKTEKAEAQAKKAKDKLKTADENAERKGAAEIAAAKKDADDARAELERLRSELDAAKEQAKRAAISGDAELTAFQMLFEGVQADVNKMWGILLKVRSREDGQLGEKLTAALLALAEKVKECVS